MLCTLCFPSLSTGSRCSASWSVWTRRTVCTARLWPRSPSTWTVACARLVLLVLLLFPHSALSGSTVDTCSASFLGQVGVAPVVVQRQAGMVQTVLTVWRCRRCSACVVVDVAAVMQRRPGVPGSPGRCLRSVHHQGVHGLRCGFWPHFAAFVALRPRGRECPFFSLRWLTTVGCRGLGVAGTPGVRLPGVLSHQLSACMAFHG